MHTTTAPADAVADSLARGETLPAWLYSDPAAFRTEIEHVFRPGWHIAGRVQDVAEPGARLIAQAGDVPVVVVRGDDGVLRGFVNVCRHRLHPVVLEAGSSRMLRCSYHGWTYGLDGVLRAAPRCMGEPGFERSDHKLVPVLVGTLGDFVFVNVDPDASPVEDALSEAPPLLDRLGLDIGSWPHVGRFVYEIGANWKLFVENSLECYHCPLVHAETFAHAFKSDDRSYVCENHENVLTQVAPVSHAPDGAGDAASLADFRLLYAWPTSFVAADEYAGIIGSVSPISVDACTFTANVYANPAADPDVRAEWMEMYDRTFAEDKLVVDRQQAGYATGLVERGRLITRSESSIAMFQRRTWQALAAHLATRE